MAHWRYDRLSECTSFWTWLCYSWRSGWRLLGLQYDEKEAR